MRFGDKIEITKDEYEAIKNNEIWKYDIVANEFLTLEDKKRYRETLDKILYENDYTDYCNFMKGKFLYDVNCDRFGNVVFYKSNYEDEDEDEIVYTSVEWITGDEGYLVVDEVK